MDSFSDLLLACQNPTQFDNPQYTLLPIAQLGFLVHVGNRQSVSPDPFLSDIRHNLIILIIFKQEEVFAIIR